MKVRILIIKLLICLLPCLPMAQGYQIGTGAVSFDNHVVKADGYIELLTPYINDGAFSRLDMPAIRIANLFSVQKAVLESIPGSDGILGTIDKPGGYIIVNVYAAHTVTNYNLNAADVRLLYHATITQTTNDYTSESSALSRNIKYNLSQLYRYGENTCSAGASAFKTAMLSLSKSQASTWPGQAVNTCTSETFYSGDLPVIISVQIRDATLRDIRIPGLLPNPWDYNNYAETYAADGSLGHTIKKREVWPVPPNYQIPDIEVQKHKAQIVQLICKTFGDYLSDFFSHVTAITPSQHYEYWKWMWQTLTGENRCQAVSSFGMGTNNANILQRFDPDENEPEETQSTMLVCTTDEMYNRALLRDPTLLSRQIAAEEEILQAELEPEMKKYEFYKLIPVVFHVLYHEDAERTYLTDYNLQQALVIVNNNFSMLNLAGVKKAPQAWDTWGHLAAEVPFRLVLANRKPDGSVTSGVEYKRVSKSIYEIGRNDADFSLVYTPSGSNDQSGLAAYPPDQYLNVWIIPDMRDQGDSTNAFTISYLVNEPAPQGIYMSGYVFDPVFKVRHPTADIGLTHETLHFLGLRHLWDPFNKALPSNTEPCLGDDGISDTHQQRLPNRRRPVFPVYSCYPVYANSGPVAALKSDMFNNFMDYTFVTEMITKGQAKRTKTVVKRYRPGLLTSQGFVAPVANRSSRNENEVSTIAGPVESSGVTSLTSRLYPTITNGRVTIDFNTSLHGDATIRIVDIMNARQVLLLKSSITGNLLTLDLSKYGLAPDRHYRLVIQIGGQQYSHTAILSRN